MTWRNTARALRAGERGGVLGLGAGAAWGECVSRRRGARLRVLSWGGRGCASREVGGPTAAADGPRGGGEWEGTRSGEGPEGPLLHQRALQTRHAAKRHPPRRRSVRGDEADEARRHAAAAPRVQHPEREDVGDAVVVKDQGGQAHEGAVLLGGRAASPFAAGPFAGRAVAGGLVGGFRACRRAGAGCIKAHRNASAPLPRARGARRVKGSRASRTRGV